MASACRFPELAPQGSGGEGTKPPELETVWRAIMNDLHQGLDPVPFPEPGIWAGVQLSRQLRTDFEVDLCDWTISPTAVATDFASQGPWHLDDLP